MATQAISAYGIEVRLGFGPPLGPFTITGASNATPIVLTTSPHSVADVTAVNVAGVLGNLAANGLWVAHRVDATHLVLRGSVGSGAYTSGGTVIPVCAFIKIAELRDLQDAGVQATLVDVSAHDGNGWSARIPTLVTGNAVRLALNLVPAHATHGVIGGLAALLVSKARVPWLIVLPDVAKTAWYFTGFVTQHRAQGQVGQQLMADSVIEFTDAAILSAA